MKYKEFIPCVEEEAPGIMKDFNQWMVDTHKKKHWKQWDTRLLLGWMLDYLSSVYIMFPKIQEEGDYSPNIPLSVSNKGETTEYEQFMYNVMAEFVRVDIVLFKL